MTHTEDRVEELKEKIRTRQAVVGVVGLGYVGLPFAVEKAKVGFRVVGVEQNPRRAEKVNRGENYIPDVRDEELKALVEQGLLRAETGFDRVPEMDVIVIAVPTPLTRNLTPDLQYVERVTQEIARRLRPGQLVSLESTTYPGTTEEVMLPILETSGLKVEEDFFLVHSPERVDPGNQRYTTKNTTKVVGGVGPRSLELGVYFYGQTIERVVPVSSAKAAELVKVFENTFRAVNIALVNELALLCDRMGLNVWEVLDAAFTKPFGIMPFYPGPGVGGHCIPIDPHYLEWKAKEYNFNTHFIALAGEINRKMPEFTAEKALRLLAEAGIPLKGAKVLVLGAAYKKDIGDYRESPAIRVMQELKKRGLEVTYHDPHVLEFDEHGFRMQSVDLTPERLQAQDLVIIATDHSAFDYPWILEHAPRVLDARGATRHLKNPKVTLL
ncbi:nucleotide sugar dehydrogenase [Thermus filiformis]|uniref:UDP-N-acetyl-D-glucosamine dehydrogenase n=1 Tax=Thermus filiformis TaxID=276 RepID=A0A0A2WVR3_THEFI|nr:nucleotide sugar dehydrogenase [Thermus filiformis]KGQ22400.1 UDP-N-acetyl-D-glucosamine dehydrogenase [Thermus filiformis]